jgi:hypothetical protein
MASSAPAIIDVSMISPASGGGAGVSSTSAVGSMSRSSWISSTTSSGSASRTGGTSSVRYSSSRSRNTRSDDFCLGAATLGLGALAGSKSGSMVLMLWSVWRERRLSPLASASANSLASCSRASAVRAAPLSCSASSRRISSLSGERSANSFSARNASSVLPDFCIRSAYSSRFCLACATSPRSTMSWASRR